MGGVLRDRWDAL